MVEAITPQQADRRAYQALRTLYGPKLEEMIDGGDFDHHHDMQILAHHAQQARLEERERIARYVEGAGGVIPGATAFVPLITGDNQPCMSGDMRDRLHPAKRRMFDDATRSLALAIRKGEAA